jgi:hypothetical protein
VRVSIVVKDLKKTVETIVHALANRLTAQENFGPTGLTGVRVLTSLSGTQIPTWETLDGDGGTGTPGVRGPKGDKGDKGDPGDPAGTDVLQCIVTSGGDVVVDNGEVVWSCDA